MRRKSPVTVQQWIDALPMSNTKTSSTLSVCHSPARFIRGVFARDVSVQSDDASSHCSSVESMLELRRPDPEAVLIGLGFGPPHSANNASRIPQRFLSPSKLLTNIDVNKFLEQQGELQYAEQNSLQVSFVTRDLTLHLRGLNMKVDLSYKLPGWHHVISNGAADVSSMVTWVILRTVPSMFHITLDETSAVPMTWRSPEAMMPLKPSVF